MTPALPPAPLETSAATNPAKGIYFIAASQFGIAFSFNCIMSFMPFYILRISPHSAKETMVWIGLIMGATSLVAALAAPFWGGLTARVRPKLLFQAGIFCNGVLFCLMGFTENLPLLLGLRMLQGAFGAVSTIGLVLIAGMAHGERLPAYMSLFQNSMTAGQLIGPPLGAYAVALFGYHAPFVIAPVITFVSLAYCRRHVQDLPIQPVGPKAEKTFTRALLWGWGLTVVGTIHLMFLPSILPAPAREFRADGGGRGGRGRDHHDGLHDLGHSRQLPAGQAVGPLGDIAPHRVRLPVGDCAADSAVFQRRRLRVHPDPAAPDRGDRGHFPAGHLHLRRRRPGGQRSAF